MNQPLRELEAERARILSQISQLGDLRPGSITAIRGRCGNPTCHCHRPNDPGHGPNFRLTRKVKSKTVSETFLTPTAQRKAEQEVTEYHRFRQLCQQFVAVNEEICRARPVDNEGLGPQEKKRPRRSSRKLHAR